MKSVKGREKKTVKIVILIVIGNTSNKNRLNGGEI